MRGLTLCVLLTGCYDFEGDEGNVGFASDLRLSTGAWTPANGIASGTSASFAAAELLRNPTTDEEWTVTATVSGLDSWSDAPSQVTVTDGRRSRGVIRWEGAAEDVFSVRFASPVRAGLVDSAQARAKSERSDRTIAVVAGSEWTFAARVDDWLGRELGVRDEDLDVRSEGGVSAWRSDDGLVVAADDAGSVSFELLGDSMGSVDVLAVSLDEISTAWVSRIPMPAQGPEELDQVAVVVHAQTDDGVDVFGMPLAWMTPGVLEQDSFVRPFPGGAVIEADRLDEVSGVGVGHLELPLRW